LLDDKDPTLPRQSMGSQRAARLSALRTSRSLLPRNIIIFMSLELISVTGRLSEPQGLVRSEGLDKFKKASSGIEPATFRFVA
jgi:hypothetical protein